MSSSSDQSGRATTAAPTQPITPASDGSSPSDGGVGPSRAEEQEDAVSAMPALGRTITGRTQRSITSSLDPAAAAELTRRLTQSSVRRTVSGKAGDLEAANKRTIDPFDADGNFDLEGFLRRLFVQGAEAGIENLEMGVGFRDLVVSGVGTGVALSEDVGSTLAKPFNIAQTIREMRNPPIKTILHGLDGCVKPGEMLLVLGRPGAGCTSFLKTLASYRDGFKSVDGEISYQGWGYKDVEQRFRGMVAYAPEDDVHFPTLTTRQTIEFAAEARSPQAQRRLDNEGHLEQSREEYVDTVVEVLSTILGLRHTHNTLVGNEFIRGVSGGERKRVSVAEIMATRAKIALYDNSSRGLDSSTALEFVRALRVATDISKQATVASLYQAGEELTKVFDKVLVLYDGRQIYMGPMDQAVAYFIEMGYVPFDRQTTADFLVYITDPHGRKVRPGYEQKVPRTAKQFEDHWRNSPQGKANRAEAEEYLADCKTKMQGDSAKHYKQVAATEKSKHVSPKSQYLLSWPQQIKLAFRRRLQLIWGDRVTQIVIFASFIFQGIIISSVFYPLKNTTAGLFSKGGVLFFSLLFSALAAQSEIAAGYANKPIVIRQRRYAMLHPAADSLANTVIDIPVRAITIVAFSSIVYWFCGLSASADQFFPYLGFVMLGSYTIVAFFRMLAALFRAESGATTVGGLAIVLLALYAGYIITTNQMKVWWRWLQRINPLSYGFETLYANEVRKASYPCANYVPSGPGYENVSRANQVCPVIGAESGQELVNGARYAELSFGYKWSHAGRNAAVMIAMWMFFSFVYALASEFQKDPLAKGGVIVFKRDSAPKEVLDATKAKGDLEDQENPAAGTAFDPAALDEAMKSPDEGKVAAVLESAGEAFTFEHVNYDITIKGKPRRLLDDVSGYVQPGKMTALMGESGAGKTTLLNVLAQRVDIGVVRGIFEVAAQPLPLSFQADTGYVQQQDVHLATSTVREALQFSALLRQPASTPREEKLAYVEEIIRMLEMESFAEAIVGEIGAGLNVEQRKRLTIAVELAAKPKLLLFLDEPTSGLDTMAAWSIVRFLKKLSRAGQSLVVTVHQPSAVLLAQFDRLILLRKGGQVVYQGDINSAKTGARSADKLLSYFEKRSGKKCGAEDNPAEWMLDVIGAGATASSAEDWNQLYRDSELYQEVIADIERIKKQYQGHVRTQEQTDRGNREFAASFATQIALVTKRAFIDYWRNPTYIMAKMALNVVGGLFISSSFYGAGSEQTIAALQTKLFASFIALIMSTSLTQQLQPEFIKFRSLFEIREKPSKMYSWPVMVAANIIVEAPWNILGGTFFWLAWYYMTGFPRASANAAYTWFVYAVCFTLYFGSFGQAIAAMSPNALIASLLFSVLFSFPLIFAKVFQPPALMPEFWRSWIIYLSSVGYFIEALLGNALGGQDVRCSARELVTITPPANQNCDQYLSAFSSRLDQPLKGTGYYESNADGTCSYCQYRTGDDYLSTVDLSAANKYRNIGIFFIFIIFNIALAFALYYLFRVFSFKKTGGKEKKVKESKESEKPDPVAAPAVAPVAAPAAA